MIEALLDYFGDAQTVALLGALVGLIFGACAQHSRFCLRAATAEMTQAHFGPRLGIWLIVFGAALASTQGAALIGWLDYSEARQIAAMGSLSGAIIGGGLFGIGMVLARGCASRLLVLSATGNMRALVTGLVLTLVAQAALTGVLAPLREMLFGLWTLPGGEARDAMLRLGLDRQMVALIGIGIFAAGILLSLWRRTAPSRQLAGLGVGLAVTLGWLGTFAISQISFEPISLTSVTFTGPSTDTLMALINQRNLLPSFGLGLVPGVFLGSGLTAIASGEFRLQRFDSTMRMERYLIGACLMGFGSMLAGGCAVGAGVSGGAILSLTAWVAVFAMWVGALLANWIEEIIDSVEAEPAKA
ncbi:MAG: YeeE/YedE family protein [Mangrovicoccus sp.]